MSSKGTINDFTFATRKYFKTVNQFIKDHPKGTFLCRKTHHAFTIIDGVVYGETKLRSIITDFWIVNDGKFVEKEKQPVKLSLNPKPNMKQIVLNSKGLTPEEIAQKHGFKLASVKWYFNKLKLK
jgi:hypothetical protein